MEVSIMGLETPSLSRVLEEVILSSKIGDVNEVNITIEEELITFHVHSFSAVINCYAGLNGLAKIEISTNIDYIESLNKYLSTVEIQNIRLLVGTDIASHHFVITPILAFPTPICKPKEISFISQ